jgi:uncharacterized protein (DUF2141 family)
MARVALVPAAVLLGASLTAAAHAVPSSPELGIAEGRCRADEKGPAFLVAAEGLKDREGKLKLEVYPANATDFLADDNVLVSAGKVFRRVYVPVPTTEVPRLCIRVPQPGQYALVLLHDRNLDRKFNWTIDGIGFSNNPKLGWGKPDVTRVAVRAGEGLTPVTIVLNYRSGLGVAPLKRSR